MDEDERLYHHMFSSHAQAILYFCKSCGLANTNGRVVYEHIIRNGCSWRNLSSAPEFVIMGFTAACIFHYQPANPIQYENKMHNNELLVVIPSECIHRSFLSHPNDVISITCPKCNSLMSFLRLQAENPRFTANLPRTLNHAADDNDAIMLTMLNIWRMEDIDQQTSAANMRNEQTPTSRSGGATSNISIRQPPSQISWVPARQSLTASSSFPSSPLQIVASRTSRAVNGTTLRLNNRGTEYSCFPEATTPTTHPSALSICKQTGLESSSPFPKTPPYLQPYRGVLEAVGLTVGTQMVTRDYIMKNAEGEYFCARSECANVRIEKITSGPPSLSLRCPLCPEILPFTQIELFRKHMAECKLRFHSIEARLRHDLEHRATKNAPCCFVCGTSRNWWFSPARINFPYIDHSYIHAFSLWGMCRECGLCYPNELKNQQYFHHFKEQHMTKALNTWHCKICDIEIDNCNVHLHPLQRHFVIGVKIDRRRPYAVETSDAVMRAFLGYSVPDNAKI
ncbi:hypothetical protein WUBG_00491 [Wuchereria bancrofti]|uniref:Uncharacterized protein n=1 Tax=Wuchereria bancrofti TaxID=6293 RepID=J9F132_WUCBA|nr:hypothetical protein WUBG_00491 [Wuchereria bancrofti]